MVQTLDGGGLSPYGRTGCAVSGSALTVGLVGRGASGDARRAWAVSWGRGYLLAVCSLVLPVLMPVAVTVLGVEAVGGACRRVSWWAVAVSLSTDASVPES
jgi:hypothetical protein